MKIAILLAISLVLVSVGFSSDALANLPTHTFIDNQDPALPHFTSILLNFGKATVNMGDINGDGTDDFIVGALFDEGSKDGSLTVIFRDETGDVLNSTFFNRYSAVMPDNAGPTSFLGTTLVNVGDLDDNGVNDVATTYFNGAGVSLLFLYLDKDGNFIDSTSLDYTSPDTPDDFLKNSFYVSLTSLENVDGDNMVLLVGEPTNGIDFATGYAPGAVHLLRLSYAIDVLNYDVYTKSGPYEQLGQSITVIDDTSSDGVDDLLVSMRHTPTGKANLQTLKLDGSFTMRDDTPLFFNATTHSTITGVTNISEYGFVTDYLGGSMISSGDFDEDNITDIILSAREDNEPVLYVLYLNESGEIKDIQTISTNFTPSTFSFFDQRIEYFTGLSNVGDPNKQGIDEISVGVTFETSSTIPTDELHIISFDTPDVIKPTFVNDLPDLTINATGTFTQIPLPTATDDQDARPIVSPSFVELTTGMHNQTWSAVDYSGNVRDQIQLVEVKDVTPPFFSDLPLDTFVVNILIDGVLPKFNLPLPAVADDTDPSPRVIHNATDYEIFGFPVGVTVVEWTVNDVSDNTSTTNQLVEVVEQPLSFDTTKPEFIDIPGDRIESATAQFTPLVMSIISATDNFDPSPTITSNATNYIDNGFPLGTTIITWTATDESGNNDSFNQKITVNDITPPTFTSTPNNRIEEATGFDTKLIIATPIASDAVDPSTTITHTKDDLFLKGFPLGNTTIVWIAYDLAGNFVEALQLITIQDTTPPVITLIGDATITIPFASDYIDAGVIAYDIYDGNLTSSIIQSGVVDTMISANYTLSFDVTDSNGLLSNQQNRTVSVSPIIILPTGGNGGGALSPDFGNTPYDIPTITLLGNSIIDIKLDTKYVDPGVNAQDHRNTILDNFVVVSGSVDTSRVGSYTLTYDLTDYNGQSAVQQTRTVNVVP